MWEGGHDYSIRTPLLRTNAPTNMRPIETRNRIVATTRTGLNILTCHKYISTLQWKVQRMIIYHLDLLEELIHNIQYTFDGMGSQKSKATHTPIKKPVPMSETTVPMA